MPTEEQKRFNGVVAEMEKRKNVCEHCNGALHWVDIPLEGIGDIAVIPYLYCSVCDVYYICGEEEDED